MKVAEQFGVGKPQNGSKYMVEGHQVEPDKSIKSNILCGVEIEVENVKNINLNSLTDYPGFSLEDDHSLRNYGMEIKTLPINCALMPGAISKILNVLGEKADFSPRTSIHFHLDVTKLDLSQLNNILATYVVFEKCLFQFVAPSRNGSIFCLPIHETDILFSKDITYLIHEWKKYSALNLKTVESFGTIEFRHLEGTKDFNKIYNWFKIILAIYDFGSKEKSSEALLEKIYALNSNSQYFEFANEVFGDLLTNLSSNLWDNMEKGVKILKMLKQNSYVKQEVYEKIYKLRAESKRKTLQPSIDSILSSYNSHYSELGEVMSNIITGGVGA